MKYKSLRKFGWAFIMLSAFLFSSCLNVEEHFHFNRDGSGSMWIKMDISDLMSMMDALTEEEDMNQDTKDDDDLFDNSETISNLKSLPGITEVKDLNDRDEGIIGYSFKFESIAALNNSLSIVNDDVSSLTESSGGGSSETRNFTYTGKKLTIRIPEGDDEEEEGDAEDEELDESMEEMMMEFMKDYTYKTTYSFEQPVKKAKNKEMVVSGDKHSVTIEKSLAELIEEDTDMGGVIKLKK